MRAVSAPRLTKQPPPAPPRWGFDMSRPLGVVWGAQARNRPSAGPFSPRCTPVYPACFTTKILASYHHTSRETRLMKQPTPCPPPVRFRYESAPGGNISPHMPPYDHRVGFICIGGTPQLGCLGQPGGTWGTPHTHKTNLVAIGGAFVGSYYPRGSTHTETAPGEGSGSVVL